MSRDAARRTGPSAAARRAAARTATPRSRVAAAALAAGALVAPVTAAADVEPVGDVCGYVAWDAVTTDGSWLTVVSGGPLVLADTDPTGNPVSGSLTCTLRDGYGGTLASFTGPTTTGVVVLPPHTTNLTEEQLDHAQVCASVNVAGGGTLYYDRYRGRWTTDPAAPCYADPGEMPLPDPLPALVETALDAAGGAVGTADAALCDVLGDLAPGVPPVTIDPTGDTDVAGEPLWDCPPYRP